MLRSTSPDLPRRGEVASFDVPHCGETFRVTLKRTTAARRFTLRVRAPSGDIILTMPARASLSDAKSFAESHAAWIGTRLARLPRRVSFEPGETVPLRGVMHKITPRRVARGTVWVELPSATDPREGAPLLCVNAEPCFVPRRVRDFLVAEARRDLESAVARYARALGARPRKLTLRDTRSRWGSCSSAGSLSFSWRLVMAPSFVLDYLAAHEVAHLLHMNHSAAFWSAVAGACPDSARAEAWLEAHGASLHRFAVERSARDQRPSPGGTAQPAGAGAPAAAATSSRRLR
jgi:predicted metal-dependent hydrolase